LVTGYIMRYLIISVFLAFTAIMITGCKKHENSSSPITPNAPAAITKAATGITSYTATLNGLVNAYNLSAVVSFSYGLTSAYGMNIPATPDSITGMTNTDVSANITGLIPDTIYHFRVIATNKDGTVKGHDTTFRTRKQQSTAAITKAATGITSYTATLNGVVNANNLSPVASFSYGLTSAYGMNIPATPDSITGMTNTDVSANITGLIPDTIYHFRVVATNKDGTTKGHDTTFRTQKQQWLVIGIPNPGITITEMNPTVVLTDKPDQGAINYPTDINGDNVDDINLYLNSSSGNGYTCLFFWLKIETLNTETFVLTDTSGYPKVLSIGDTIKTNDRWENGNLLLLYSFSPCVTWGEGHQGNWYNIQQKYVGIKCNGLLGWMMIGTPGQNNCSYCYNTINFYKYAITK